MVNQKDTPFSLKQLIITNIVTLLFTAGGTQFLHHLNKTPSTFGIEKSTCRKIEIKNDSSQKTDWSCDLIVGNQTKVNGQQNIKCSLSEGNFYGQPTEERTGQKRKVLPNKTFTETNSDQTQVSLDLMVNEKIKITFSVLSNGKYDPRIKCEIVDF